MEELGSLLQRASAGDRAAFEEFVGQAQADVWRYCRAMLTPHLADDASHETFLEAWRTAPRYQPQYNARLWLLRVARNVSAAHLRKLRRIVAARADVVAAPSIYDVLTELDIEARSAFVLTQLCGLSYQQAGEVCSCPGTTIRKRVASARATLLNVDHRAAAAGNGDE